MATVSFQQASRTYPGTDTPAVDALDRINVIKVGDLIKVWGRKLARMRGVGNKTRKRILAAVKVLRERLGSTTAGEVPTNLTDDAFTYDGQVPLQELGIDDLL